MCIGSTDDRMTMVDDDWYQSNGGGLDDESRWEEPSIKGRVTIGWEGKQEEKMDTEARRQIGVPRIYNDLLLSYV